MFPTKSEIMACHIGVAAAAHFFLFSLAFLRQRLLLEVRAYSSLALAEQLPVNVSFLEWMMKQFWNDMNNWIGSFLLYFQLLLEGTVTGCVVEKTKVQQQQVPNHLQNLVKNHPDF